MKKYVIIKLLREENIINIVLDAVCLGYGYTMPWKNSEAFFLLLRRFMRKHLNMFSE